MNNWRRLIAAAQIDAGDSTPIISCTLPKDLLDREFDDGFGHTEGESFTAWSQARVYFPVQYDGSEWVGSAPRNPCDERTRHQGG